MLSLLHLCSTACRRLTLSALCPHFSRLQPVPFSLMKDPSTESQPPTLPCSPKMPLIILYRI